MASYMANKMYSRRTTNDFYGYYVFIVILLEVLGETHMSVHDNNHAFMQAKSNDVRFMGVHDDLQSFINKDIASSNMRITQSHESLEDEDAFSTNSYLKFVPPRLDFKERFLGVPHLEKVTLVNTDDNKTIHMSSVSGNTLHFHSSFFQDKTIPPKGNTSFAVVFLGHTEGLVSTNLYIHTSEGTFKYQVSGASICSPYRLRPLGGVRLPLNAAFQPLIQLHNPHNYPIQVVEVYSSGGEFHLELPGGEAEGPKVLWEVPPYTTKPVIRAKFQANAQSNHTAYIRLKLNNSEEVLVVPLEVEVTSQPGLYSQQHSIDFGIGGSRDPPKKLRLYLCSSLKKALRIQGISTVPAVSALRVNFEATKVPPGTTPVEVAELIFDWKVAFETKETSGTILIKSKQNQYKLSIPFTARVLEGGLKVSESSTHFLTAENRISPQNFVVENQFQVSVAVNNVSLLKEASHHFQIRNFKPMVIPPNKSVTLFSLSPKGDGLRDLTLESGLVLSTNISEVTAPLLAYSGKLTKIFPRGFDDSDVLNVGLVGCSNTKTLRFALQNHNPVDIAIKSLESNTRFVSPQILGVYGENSSSEFSSQYNFANLTNSTNLKPNDIAVIELVIETSKNEEVMTAEVSVFTQYGKLTIPVRVSVAPGSLQMIPNQVILDDCFPGKICTQPLKIQSTFGRPMTTTSVSRVPPDSRLSFAPAPGGSEILPGVSNYIGDLKWEPGKYCGNHCYLGVTLNSTSGGLQWMQSDVLSSYTSDMDATLLRDRYHRLLNLTDGFGSGYWQDMIVRLDTNEVREELFKARVRLVWPKFASGSKLTFPLTQVSNTTIQRLKLFNSASHMVVVQLVMEWSYPQSKRLVDSFPPRTNVKAHCFNSSPKEFYFLRDATSGPEDRQGILNATLAPGESYEFPVAYTPGSPQKSCSLLFIRNNLTVVEVVELHGQASYAQLKFGNRKPGSENPLMFEIAEKHLKDCQKDKNKKPANPNLTVKRSFTVRNVGELSIFVHNFYINGLECEGYGYSVLNCASFELPINGTRKIDVAFTPDFTLTKVQRTLTIDTSLGTEVNYTLVTILPPFFLSACSSVLGRPTWEPLLYYSAVSFMVFLLFCVLAAAFFESDRILKCALITLTRERATVPLDLRLIGANVLKEFNHHPSKKVDALVDHTERVRAKDPGPQAGVCGSGSSWSASLPSEDKHTPPAIKEEKSEGFHAKSEESLPPSTSMSSYIQFQTFTKTKKKLSKKNSSNSDVAIEQAQEIVASKKKEKNFTNQSWCSVFSRGNVEKTKGKQPAGAESESVKSNRHDAEVKKEETRREEKRVNKGKKFGAAKDGICKEEEETSSTTTESSNDADKDSTEPVAVKGKTEKPKKIGVEKERKTSVSEYKESSYEGDIDEEEFEKDKKGAGKSACKTNGRSGKLASSAEIATNSWKTGATAVTSSAVGGVETLHKTAENHKQKVVKNVIREKKEKMVNKRRLIEKAVETKTAEPAPIPQRTSPCWEHRSFSEVVAKSESPLLYSNIVKNYERQNVEKRPSESLYSEAERNNDGSGTALGPIGSKKPPSQWSPLAYNCTSNQSNVFCSNYADFTPPVQYPQERSHAMNDSLPVNPITLWGDQQNIMQLMHQTDISYSMSWKENWLDYLWSSNRNSQQNQEMLPSSHEMASDGCGSPWGSSVLRSSWSSAPTWGQSGVSNGGSCSSESDSIPRQFPAYGSLPESENYLRPRDLQNATMNLGAGGSVDHGSSNQVLFGTSNEAALRNRSRENLSGDGFQFDPFHSLSSIWSPKSQNTWNSTGN